MIQFWTDLSLTGFYLKLKSFWSCSHINCCLQNILHNNLHILDIYFIKLNLDLKELQGSSNYFKRHQEKQDELYLNFEFTSKFEC